MPDIWRLNNKHLPPVNVRTGLWAGIRDSTEFHRKNLRISLIFIAIAKHGAWGKEVAAGGSGRQGNGTVIRV